MVKIGGNMCIYIYIYIPGAPIRPLFLKGFSPPRTRPFPTKTRVIRLLGTYRYIIHKGHKGNPKSVSER